MRHVVLCDIDHTLTNAFWRDDMIASKDWDAYHSAGVNDKPVEDVCNMIRLLSQNCYIVGLTARPEKWRKLTMEWLVQNKVPMEELLMRPNKDFRPSHDLKVDLVRKRFRNFQEEVMLVLDDRQDVCEAFAGQGVTAMQIYARKT